MNINLAYAFVSLCKYHNISIACEYLNISQQGLSKQIKSLERELDVELFERTNSGVILTEVGKKIQPHIEEIIERYERVVNITDNEKRIHDSIIKVGIAQGVTSAIGLKFIAEFSKQYPNIQIITTELYDKECEDYLSNGDIDFAFLVHTFDESRFKQVNVFHDYAYVSINNNHEFAKTKESISMKDLDRQPVLILDENYILRSVFDEYCKKLDIKPNIIFSTNSVASYINLPETLVSISIIFKFFVQHMESNNVTIIPMTDAPDYNIYFSKSIKQEKNSTFRVFEKFINEYFDKNNFEN